MSNEKVEFELGFVDSPDSGRQLQALAEQVEKTQQRMSASVKAFSDDMQNSVRQIATAASHADGAGGSGGSSGPSVVSVAKADADESAKHNKRRVDDAIETGRKLVELGRRGAQGALALTKDTADQISRAWGDAVTARRAADTQLAAITESSGRRSEQALRSQAQNVNELRDSFSDLAGQSVNAASAMARLGRGVALFSGSESENMEKVLRTIMKIQGAMDLIQGGGAVVSGVRNHLLPAGRRFGAALAASGFTGGPQRGYDLARQRGVGVFRGAASSMAGGLVAGGGSAAAGGGVGRSVFNYAAGSVLAQSAMRYGGQAIAAGRAGLSSAGSYAGRVFQAIPGRLGTMGARIGQALGPQTAGLVGGSPLAGSASTYIGTSAAAGTASTAAGRGMLSRAGGSAARFAGRAGGAALRMGARVGGTLASAPVVAGTLAAGGIAAAIFGEAGRSNSSAVEGSMMGDGVMNRYFGSRKFTVGGVADQNGQRIARFGNALNNLVGSVVGAQRSFDMLGEKQTARLQTLNEQLRVMEAYNDELRKSRRFERSNQRMIRQDFRSMDVGMRLANMGSSSGEAQRRASQFGIDMTIFREQEFRRTGRRSMGQEELNIQKRRLQDNQKMADFYRKRRQGRVDLANQGVDAARERMEAAEEAVGEGPSAAVMERYNSLVDEFQGLAADRQDLLGEYNQLVGNAPTAVERDITGQGAGPGENRGVQVGSGQAVRFMGMDAIEAGPEAIAVATDLDQNSQLTDQTAEEMRRMEQEYGINGGFTDDEIDEQRTSQEELNRATDDYIAKQEEAKRQAQLAGQEMIDMYRAQRQAIEDNIITLEREKIALENRDKDLVSDLAFADEMTRNDMMIAAQKLQEDPSQLTQAEYQMLRSQGNADTQALLDQEAARRDGDFFANDPTFSATFLTDEEQREKQEKIDEAKAQQATVEQDIIDESGNLGLSGQDAQGGTLEIIDQSNIEITLSENVDTITARAVNDIIDALETRSERLKDEITEEVTRRLNGANANRRNNAQRSATNILSGAK